MRDTESGTGLFIDTAGGTARGFVIDQAMRNHLKLQGFAAIDLWCALDHKMSAGWSAAWWEPAAEIHGVKNDRKCCWDSTKIYADVYADAIIGGYIYLGEWVEPVVADAPA